MADKNPIVNSPFKDAITKRLGDGGKPGKSK